MTDNNSSEGSVEAHHNVITHEKVGAQNLEQVPIHDRVPGHTNYYEKDGLRTYGKLAIFHASRLTLLIAIPNRRRSGS